MMSAGRRRQRVTLMRKVRDRNENGGFVTTWAPIGAPIAAEVLGISGSESVMAEALQGVEFYRVTMLYRPDITDRDQLAYAGKTLNVRSAQDRDGRRRETLILADTGSPQASAA